MKIAIPTNDKSLESGVCPAFGRAPCFLLYETESKEYDFIDNDAAGAHGGAGVAAAQKLVDNKIDVLICPRCGQNAAQVLQADDVKIYLSESISIPDTIAAFEKGDLVPLTPQRAGINKFRGKA